MPDAPAFQSVRPRSIAGLRRKRFESLSNEDLLDLVAQNNIRY